MLAADFDQLQTKLAEGGVDAVLDQLVEQLREKKLYHELFEALKVRVRHRLGLPLFYGETPDELDEIQRDALEEGLLDSCREVGLSLLRDGRVREGWMYLRPVGDREAAARVLADIAANDDNLDDLIEVTLNEAVDPARGFGLVLEHYGTCNAITTYESAVAQHSRPIQQTAAGMLVEHLHSELMASVKADIAQQEGNEPAETTLEELVADRPWLFGENSYHLDTTHLAATVRFSRILENPDQLRLALDLTHYGRRLSAQFQYPSEEPFAELYPSHAFYLQALLGENVDEALAYFRQRAETLDSNEHGTAPLEVYVQLLARLGRAGEAIDTLIQRMPQDARPMGLAPSLLELSEQAGNYDRLLQYCRQREDLLGFAAGLLKSAQAKT